MKKNLLLYLLTVASFSSLQSQVNINKDSTAIQPQIFAEGIISTGEYETHPAFSPSGDTVYFLKCMPDLQVCAICVSYHQKAGWSTPVTVPFSGQYLDADPFVTKDGNTVYFVSNRPVKEGDPVKEDWDIWKVERTGNTWKEPFHLDTIVNSNGSEFYPTIADNGTLYFGSSREGGKGASDIYYSVLSEGKFTTPKNPGDSINTTDNEYEPFIAPDESYLIFMATIPKGLINGDFYISYKKDGEWSKAKKIRAPVNSAATEWSPKVTHDGKYFFFGSTRNKLNGALPEKETLETFEKRLRSAGNGLSDIYYINFSALKTVQ